MPLTAPHRQSPGGSNQFGKTGLFLLLLAMSIGLGIWLYSNLRKKESYRHQQMPGRQDTMTTSR